MVHVSKDEAEDDDANDEDDEDVDEGQLKPLDWFHCSFQLRMKLEDETYSTESANDADETNWFHHSMMIVHLHYRHNYCHSSPSKLFSFCNDDFETKSSLGWMLNLRPGPSDLDLGHLNNDSFRNVSLIPSLVVE